MIVKGRNVSTATAAPAYRIYGHCAPGWGHTYAEVADALGVSAQRVQRAAVVIGWNGRFTAVSGRDRIDEITGGGMRDMYPTSADLEPIRRMAAMAGDEE